MYKSPHKDFQKSNEGGIAQSISKYTDATETQTIALLIQKDTHRSTENRGFQKKNSQASVDTVHERVAF